MKSRISIDLDESNNPIIKIEYAHSDDVRDKMVKRFLEGFSGDSAWAKFQFSGISSSGSTSQLLPIPFVNLEEEAKTMTMYANTYKETTTTEAVSNGIPDSSLKVSDILNH